MTSRVVNIMQKRLIDLYNLVFFKNPKRPYLLWWQVALVYLQWVVIITCILLFFDIDVEQHKSPKAIYMGLVFIVLFGSYAALDQKFKEIKIRFLFLNGLIMSGKITRIQKSNILSRAFCELFTGRMLGITYTYNDQKAQTLFFKRKLKKHFPNIQEGMNINILVSKSYPNYFIWDFDTIYFNINKNYKKCEK
ncbi:MAG: hypothetical protein HON23_02120 [Rickettsiales bacterium]|jgi:hypothetical protein|nr:hypothetical protein [Rickettsiales bacterium]